MNDNKIPSFQKDHDKILPGLYESGKDKELTVFELRFIKPNSGRYIGSAAMHSIEHILAVLLRNSHRGGDIVYFGPMGCRTGFYLITRNIDIESLKKLLIECCSKAQNMDSVPGATRKECGNYKEHNLTAAKKHLNNFIRHI